MAMLFRLALVLPLLMTSFAWTAEAQACEARVLHTGNVVQGKRIYSHWLIGHSPSRWATVSFRYRVTYIDEANEEGRIEGRFEQLISGREEEYVELKNLRQRPATITRTEISDITCAP